MTVIPVANMQQVAGTVGNTGSVTYAFQVDGSAGLNSDVVVLIQPDLSRVVLGMRTQLEFTLSTSIPTSLSALYWNSLDFTPLSDNVNLQPALQPISYVLNTQSGPECATCASFDPTRNQTLYITVFASTFQYTVGTGGPFLLSVTYAPRVALTQSVTSYTGALTAGISQTFTYTPVAANVGFC